jgi:hypothetical protein
VKVTITFANKDDLAFFKRYIEMANSQQGTVGGLYAGLLCSALKRAKVKHHKTKTP